jgi:aarF domain-containing kinase
VFVCAPCLTASGFRSSPVQAMWSLCSDLRAFYAKVGQLIAMQAFVPPAIRSKLSRLQSAMPPLPAAAVREILSAALPPGMTIASTFSRIDLNSALGCASVAQVHYGELSDARRTRVAVKVQLPAAERLMAADLGNLRLLARVLERTDLKFDLVRPVDELRAQLAAEFDFEAEARAMVRIHAALRRVKGVRVPRPVDGLVSRRLLVMEYLDGLPLARLEGQQAGKRAMRRVGRAVMRRLGDAYGEMILREGACDSVLFGGPSWRGGGVLEAGVLVC